MPSRWRMHPLRQNRYQSIWNKKQSACLARNDEACQRNLTHLPRTNPGSLPQRNSRPLHPCLRSSLPPDWVEIRRRTVSSPVRDCLISPAARRQQEHSRRYNAAEERHHHSPPAGQPQSAHPERQAVVESPIIGAPGAFQMVITTKFPLARTQ